MTSVDYFRAFAADTSSKTRAYYFEHSREDLDFSNLFDADGPEDDQLKMFHFTDSIDPEVNESGSVEGVRYTGQILALKKGDMANEVIDVQKGGDKADGKYEKRVKALIEDGGLVAEIVTFNECSTTYQKEISFSDLKEVYNLFDFNGDGIWFRYEIFIKV